MVAAGCLTGILAAHYINRYFNQKEENSCKSRAETLSGQKSVDYKYLWKFRCIENFQGTKNGKPCILKIAGIKPIIPEM